MEDINAQVSVVIPAYNAEKFIRRTIESVLAQTFRDFELIVADDGSKDRTGEIIREMQKNDKRIRYYYNDNKGLANTRNYLVALSRGKFVAFLDHDDEWLPPKLEKQMRIFKENTAVGLVFSDAYIENNGKTIGRSFRERDPYRGDIFYKYLFSDNFAPLLTVVAPKEVLLRFMPFNAAYQVNEEFELFLRIARYYKFDYVDEPLAIYHIHGANTIIVKNRKFIDESFAIIDFWINADPEIKLRYRKELNNRLAQLYCKKGVYFLSEHNLKQTCLSVMDSFKYKLANIPALKLSVKLIMYFLKNRNKNNVESTICT